MTRVAVIGGGAAGIGAAQTLLDEGCEVVILEAAPRLGGNCVGFDVKDAAGRTHTIDVGVSDFNRTTFKEVSRLIDGLGLETQPIDTSTNFVAPDGAPLWSCRDGQWRFARPLEGAERMVEEIARFRTRAVEVLDNPWFIEWTVERYLDYIGASRAFREAWLYPRAMGCFPMPDCHPKDYRIRRLVRFWNLHGIVSLQPADRHCVVGGMHRYVRAFEEWFAAQGGEVRCGTRVIGVARGPRGVEVRTADRADRHRRLVVDDVVMTHHARDVLPLLEDATLEERAALSRFACQRARLVVHTDARLVGGDPDAYGAFNYVVPEGELPRVKPTVTFFPKRLGRLPAEVPEVFVTMNPHVEPHPDRVLAERFFLHPIAHAGNDRLTVRVDRLQGRQRTWYAGSYLREPFVHESALCTGIDVARRLMRAERVRPARDHDAA